MLALSGKAARMTRAAAIKNELQLEDDEKFPIIEAEEAVVATVKVPLTAAVVPDAVTLPLNEAVPEPPATCLSCSSFSSIKISIVPLFSMKMVVGSSEDTDRVKVLRRSQTSRLSC
jgi:hypothetical protein